MVSPLSATPPSPPPQVNEWDSRHVEEPAYETRQEGYAAVSSLLAAKTSWSIDSVLPILHNAIFTLNTVPLLYKLVCLFVCLIMVLLCAEWRDVFA